MVISYLTEERHLAALQEALATAVRVCTGKIPSTI
jgi:hypothetical protein